MTTASKREREAAARFYFKALTGEQEDWVDGNESAVIDDDVVDLALLLATRREELLRELVPETFTIANPLHVQWKADNPHADFWSVPEEARARFSPEGAELLSQLDAIVSRYHDSRGYESGVETLYSENFHKRIDWDWEIERADRERLAAQLAAAKVAPEAPAPATQPEKPRFRVLAICTPVEGATIRPVQANSACNTI